MYTIGQVAQMFRLPISTLRYYDKAGLFPRLDRQGGARRFAPEDVEALRLVLCLKRAGLEIREIKQFASWCAQGPATYPQRRALLVKRREAVQAEMEQLGRTLDMLTYKCWYYETAMAEGGEERLKGLSPQQMPEDIRRAYENAHREGE